MTTKTLNGKTILAVEVPDDVSRVVIFEDYNGVKKLADNWADEEFMPFYVLPEGQWSILGRAKDIGEEQAQDLVEYYTDECHGQITHWSEFKNYENDKGEWFVTALESFQSWLKAEGIKETDLLIIKNS